MKLIALYIAILTSFGLVPYAQQATPATPPVRHDLLGRNAALPIQIQTPQPFQFQPVSTINSPQLAPQPMLPDVSILGLQNRDIINRNNQLLREQNSFNNTRADIERELQEEQFYREYMEWLNKSAYYRSSFAELMRLNPDSFSITKAVYLVENAFLENQFSFETFLERFKLEAKIIRQQLKAEKLDAKDNIAINYAIQKRFRTGGQYYDAKKKATVQVKPFKYDFEDYKGKKDYRQVFVSKMLMTGKGQCHNMPLGYLMIAEQLGAKAWLSLAPEHSFIRFSDHKGNLLNFETTSSNLVSNNWLQQSGYINAAALKNRIYLDTLSQRQLYAQCLADLLQGYLTRFPYDAFANEIHRRILALNPSNLSALMIDANLKSIIAERYIAAAGNPAEKDLPNYPEAYKAYVDLQTAIENVDGLGYQEMPAEAYQNWLRSVESEKKKQENQEIQQKLQREIDLKKQRPKTTITHKLN